MYIIFLFILMSFLSGCYTARAEEKKTSQESKTIVMASETRRYDKWFEEYTRIHLPPAISPRWPKAVAIAESNLRVDAKSPVGALGLVQFMPATWSWIAPEPWKSAGPMDPESAIWVGCYFLRWNWNRIPVPDIGNRKAMVNSAYNSGLGWLQKARNKCKPPCDNNVWDNNVENCLITNKAAQLENKNYVRRIRKFERQLLMAGEFI